MLCVIDEFTRESLVIRVARKLRSTDIIDIVDDLSILQGIPARIRFDKRPKFVGEGGRWPERAGHE
jgi:putative transposase